MQPIGGMGGKGGPLGGGRKGKQLVGLEVLLLPKADQPKVLAFDFQDRNLVVKRFWVLQGVVQQSNITSSGSRVG